MENIEEEEKQRFLFLNKLYSLVNGKRDSPINMYEIGKLIGFNDNIVNSIVGYLEGEELVNNIGYGGTITGLVAITHKGIKEVDQARNNPNSSTSTFSRQIVYVAGDFLSTGAIIGSTGINIGKDNTIGNIDININSLNKTLTTINNEYSKSLSDFSQKIKNEIDNKKISESQAKPIFQNIEQVAKDITTIKDQEENDIDYENQLKIELGLSKTISSVLTVLPEWSETIANFTPLAPFSKLIGKTVEKIVERITKKKH